MNFNALNRLASSTVFPGKEILKYLAGGELEVSSGDCTADLYLNGIDIGCWFFRQSAISPMTASILAMASSSRCGDDAAIAGSEGASW